MVVSGCGSATELRCELGSISISSVAPVDCEAAAANIDHARRAMDSAGAVLSADFDSDFAGLSVTIQEAETWRSARGHMVTGEVSVFGVLYVGPSMEAFVHELLHAHDARRWKFDTIAHHDWDGRGYTMADRRYRAALPGLRTQPE